jgi:hypothetical protein
MTDSPYSSWSVLELAEHLRACQELAHDLDDQARAEPPGDRRRSVRVDIKKVRTRARGYREELQRRGVDPEWLPV